MSKYSVEIQGKTPYLQHKFGDVEQLDRTKKKVIQTQAPDVKDAAYINSKGEYYLPAIHIERTFTHAGKNFKGRGRSSLFTILAAMTTVEPAEITDFTPQKYVEDVQIGNNPNSGKGGNKVKIVRPRFDNWSARFTLNIDTEDIPDDRIKEILEFAGNFVGIGDFRPQKAGKYGRFAVIKFQKI